MAGGGNFKGYQGAGGQPPAGMPNWANGSNMGSGGTGAWGGNYGNQIARQSPAAQSMYGPDTGSSIGSGPSYNWAGPGGGNVQNPGMPNYGYPGGGGGYGAPVKSVMPYPGMPNGVGGYPSYNPGGGQGGDTSWNGPMPPGFTSGSGVGHMALVEYENPTTGQKWTAPGGGYTAPPGWNIVGGPGAGDQSGNRIQPGTEGPSLIGGGPDEGWVPDNPRGFAHEDRGSNFGKAANWAGQGKMGRAKQAIEAGGGTWGKDMHRFLKNRPRKMVIDN